MNVQMVETAGPGHRWCFLSDGKFAAGFRGARFGLAVCLGYVPVPTHGFGAELRFATFQILGLHGAREDAGSFVVYLFKASFFVRLGVTLGRWTDPASLVAPPVQDDGVVQKGDYE